MSARLGSVPLGALASLCGVPLELLAVNAGAAGPEVLLRGFADWFSGNRRYPDAVAETLDDGHIERALALLHEGLAEGQRSPDDLHERVLDAWRDRIEGLNTRRQIVLRTLNGLHPDAVAANEDAAALSAKLPGALPVPAELPALEEIEEFKRLEREFDGLEDETEFLKAFAVEEVESLKARFYEKALHAFQRILDMHRAGDLRNNRHALRALHALPQLVLDRSIDLMAQLADSDHAFDDLVLPETAPSAPRSSAAPLRRTSRMPQVAAADPKLLAKLSTVSQSQLGAVSDTPRGRTIVESVTGISDIERRASLQPDASRRSQIWLTAASEDPVLQARIVGEGLLAAGQDQDRRGRPELAGPLFEDALRCLILSDSPERTEQALLELVRLGAGGSHDDLSSALTAPHALQQLARTWAIKFASDSGVSRGVMRLASAAFGDDSRLLSVFAEKLLTPHNLLTNPSTVVDGLLDLITDAEPPARLREALSQLGEELSPDTGVPLRVGPGRRRVLESLAETLATEFDALLTDGPAPITEIRERLLALVEGIARSGGPATVAEGPKLTVHPRVTSLYPADKHDEVLLPIVVKNGDDGAPSTNLTLRVRVYADDSREGITLTPERRRIGTLEPGEEKELDFYLDLPRGIEKEHTGLRIETVFLQDGAHTKEARAKRTFRLHFRPESRKARRTPFEAGVAVEGEQFVGREQEMSTLVSTLSSDVGKTALVVHGIRRIGKTSVIKRLARHSEITRRFHTRVWSVEDRPDSDTTEKFLFDLATELRGMLPAGERKRLRLHKAEFAERPYAQFAQFIGQIDQLGLSRRVLLIIDEFDRILFLAAEGSRRMSEATQPFPPTECFQPETLGAIRKVIMGSTMVSFVFSGLPAILKSGYKDRLFGTLHPIGLRPFKDAECLEIISAGEPLFVVGPTARARILRAVGGQPYLLQMLCAALFTRMKFEGRDEVSLYDVHEVISTKLLPNEGYIADYDTLIGDHAETLLGLALAHEEAAQREFVSVREVRRVLASHDLHYDEAHLLETLTALSPESGGEEIERPLVHRAVNDHRRFRLVVGLLGDHLRRRHGLYS